MAGRVDDDALENLPEEGEPLLRSINWDFITVALVNAAALGAVVLLCMAGSL